MKLITTLKILFLVLIPSVSAQDINISDLPKKELFQALFERASSITRGFDYYNPSQKLSEEEIQYYIKYYTEFVTGRKMRIDVSGNTVNTELYNMDNGANTAEKVIQRLRLKLTQS